MEHAAPLREAKRWRLMVDAGEFLTLADEDFTSRSEVEENGDQIIGPLSVDQLVESAPPRRGLG